MDPELNLWVGHLRTVLQGPRTTFIPDHLVTRTDEFPGGGRVDHTDPLSSVAQTFLEAGVPMPLTAESVLAALPPGDLRSAVLEALTAANAPVDPAVLPRIQGEVQEGTTHAQEAERLNRPFLQEVPGPVAPTRIVLRDLMSALDAPTRIAVTKHERFPMMLSAAKVNDHEAVSLWLQILTDDGTITPADLDTLQALVDRTEQGSPTQIVQESWSLRTLGRPVTVDEVAQARAL